MRRRRGGGGRGRGGLQVWEKMSPVFFWVCRCRRTTVPLHKAKAFLRLAWLVCILAWSFTDCFVICYYTRGVFCLDLFYCWFFFFELVVRQSEYLGIEDSKPFRHHNHRESPASQPACNSQQFSGPAKYQGCLLRHAI